MQSAYSTAPAYRAPRETETERERETETERQSERERSYVCMYVCIRDLENVYGI